jgi:tRNA nucleotidyltransferase/poly(A) polymerase
MMRALEYGVRLGFEVDGSTVDAIDRCRDMIREASPARLTYELVEGLRSGHAAGICQSWRGAGLFERAFPSLVARDGTTGTILRAVDRGVSAGISYPDASMIGGFFLADCYRVIEQSTDEKGRLRNVELLSGLRELLEPSAAALHLANHTFHLVHQGLFTLSKMRRPPERGRQVLKLVRQEYFPVTWDLFTFALESGLVSPEVHASWARAVDRVRRGELDDAPSGRRRRRPRRRRSSGGRRR